MTTVRIELNRDGVRQAALTSPEVRAELARIGEATASRARSQTNNEVEVVEGGKGRARVYVRMLGADAAALEAKERILGRSLTNGG